MPAQTSPWVSKIQASDPTGSPITLDRLPPQDVAVRWRPPIFPIVADIRERLVQKFVEPWAQPLTNKIATAVDSRVGIIASDEVGNLFKFQGGVATKVGEQIDIRVLKEKKDPNEALSGATSLLGHQGAAQYLVSRLYPGPNHWVGDLGAYSDVRAHRIVAGSHTGEIAITHTRTTFARGISTHLDHTETVLFNPNKPEGKTVALSPKILGL